MSQTISKYGDSRSRSLDGNTSNSFFEMEKKIDVDYNERSEKNERRQYKTVGSLRIN